MFAACFPLQDATWPHYQSLGTAAKIPVLIIGSRVALLYVFIMFQSGLRWGMVYRQGTRASIVQLYAQETKHHSTSKVTVTTTVCLRACASVCMCDHTQMQRTQQQTAVNSFGHKKEELKSYGFNRGGICLFSQTCWLVSLINSSSWDWSLGFKSI